MSTNKRKSRKSVPPLPASGPSSQVVSDSEHRFRLLTQAVQDYAIFILDTEGHVASWNAGAERIKGYEAHEIIGKHFSCFYPEEDIQAGKSARELEIAERDGRLEDEGWRVRKDGSRFWANVVITALKDESGVIVGFSKVVRDIVAERIRVQQAMSESQRKLEDSEKSLRQLSHHLLKVQDEERRRIGKELHDSLGQELILLKMNLDGLKKSAEAAQMSMADDLAKCAQQVEDSIKEVRTISYLLYPPMLEELGLKSAIRWYLEGYTQRSGIETSFDIPDDFKRLDPDIELALYRVLQESLTNVHRHSGSPTAAIRLVMDGDAVILEVQDAGKGTGITAFEESGEDWTGALSVGLRGMTERIRQLGGKFKVISTGEGTLVRATVFNRRKKPR